MVRQEFDSLKSLTSLLNGIGQIMLQGNAWTGLFFLVGIGCGSFIMGAAAVIATVTGTLTARILKYGDIDINTGLYGFNAALVGVALVYFFQPTISTWFLLIIGSALSTLVQRVFIRKRIPAFTFPFIVVTWLLLTIAPYFPTLIPAQPTAVNVYINNYLHLFSHGFGQIIFQDNIWAGALFVIGVCINRPIAGLYGIVGIGVSAVLAFQLKEPVNDIYLGLLSYNAALCAITFAGKKKEDTIKGLIAVVLSVLITILMRNLNIPVLTFPFVLAVWLTMAIKTPWRTVKLIGKG